MGDKKLALGSLIPTGNKEHKEKCHNCGRDVYVMNDWDKYDLDGFSCIECLVKLHGKASELIVTDETAEFFGMSKDDLKEIAELQIQVEKERKKLEAIAG